MNPRRAAGRSLAAALALLPPPELVINEVLVSHVGPDDTEFVELWGTPNASLDGVSFIVVEGDVLAQPGRIDRRMDFGLGHVIGTNRFYLAGNPDGLGVAYGVAPDLRLGEDIFENSSMTLALVETSSLTGFYVTGAEVVIDAVALSDGDAGDTFFFGAPVLGPDGPFFPAGVRRHVDGQDTDTTADWAFADFALGQSNTPIPGVSPFQSPIVDIMTIQGASHLSPLAYATVRTSGVVTRVEARGFYLQDPIGDGDRATSDGIFVFSNTSPSLGSPVNVESLVHEFASTLPAALEGLSMTELSAALVDVQVPTQPLPTPVVIGAGGQVPPTEIIDDDGFTSFDINTDGADFWESLEGMLVELPDVALLTSPDEAGVFWVVSDQGAGATGVNLQGGLTTLPGDLNPERIAIDADAGLCGQVGDLLDPVTGILTYEPSAATEGLYGVIPSHALTLTPSGVPQEVSELEAGVDIVTVASMNGFDVHQDHARPDRLGVNAIARLAETIVANLEAPDIVALQEVFDDSGPVDDGEVAADSTFADLIAAIVAAGGPVYDHRQIDPVDGADGGDGGNPRAGFLFNPLRVSFLDRGAAGPNDATGVVLGGDGGELTLSPGRIDPTDPIFAGERKPLAGEFSFAGERFVVINVHYREADDCTPLFGAIQPPTCPSDTVRLAQAQVVNDFLLDELAPVDASLRAIIVGSTNHGALSQGSLIEPGIFDLVQTITSTDAHTFVRDGTGEMADGAFANGPGRVGASTDLVHATALFTGSACAPPVAVSDHDAIVVAIDFSVVDVSESGPPPGIGLLGPYPSPIRSVARMTLHHAGGRFALRVFDAAGRLVRTIVDGVRGAGHLEVRWDGKNARGHEVPPGVYYFEYLSAETRLTRRAVIAR